MSCIAGGRWVANLAPTRFSNKRVGGG